MNILMSLFILNLIIQASTDPQLLGGGMFTLTESTDDLKTQYYKSLIEEISSNMNTIKSPTIPKKNDLDGINTPPVTNENYLNTMLTGFPTNKMLEIYNFSTRTGIPDDNEIIRSTPDTDINNRIMTNISKPIVIDNCIESLTLSSNKKTCKGELIFEETFQTNKLNSTIWSKEIRIPSDADDGDFISYQDLPENCYIKNEYLHIVPTLLENTDGFNADSIRRGTLNFDKRCTAGISNFVNECSRTALYSRILPPVVSARIGTRKNFSFRYGRIEIKAKLPKGDWIFPQLLLEPYSTRLYGDNGYASGQIRIAFIRGNDMLENKNGEQIDGYRLYGGVVLRVGEAQRDKFLVDILHDNHLSDNFHTYTMIWTNESLTFELDGVVYGQINGGFSNNQNFMDYTQSQKWKNGGFMAPFDQEFFISLGVSAGGISDFPDDSRNGRRRSPKPWINTDPKAELRFWNNRTNWIHTWNREDAGLKVDYIKVWAL